MNEIIMMMIEDKRFRDYAKQVAAIRKKQAGISSVPVYQNRNDKSGFRSIELSTGEKFYGVYRSTSEVKTGDVIPGYNVNKSVEGIGSIDLKPQ